NQQDPTLVSLGGGIQDVHVRMVHTDTEKMIVIHLHVDTKDAMGANAVNTMAEAASPFIEKITNGKVILRILSNLADERMTRVSAVLESPILNDQEAIDKFYKAAELAIYDPYRAAL